MATYDERRAAAERLRAMDDYETTPAIVRTALGLAPGQRMDPMVRLRLSDHIADLIDPGKMVDRAKLLKLADEYDKKSVLMRERYQAVRIFTIQTSFDSGALLASSEVYGDAARRIRDALGG